MDIDTLMPWPPTQAPFLIQDSGSDLNSEFQGGIPAREAGIHSCRCPSLIRFGSQFLLLVARISFFLWAAAFFALNKIAVPKLIIEPPQSGHI